MIYKRKIDEGRNKQNQKPNIFLILKLFQNIPRIFQNNKYQKNNNIKDGMSVGVMKFKLFLHKI